MKSATLLLLGLVLAGGAHAQSRPTSTTMACASARGLIDARGAFVLNTGTYTYDRYVSGGQFCATGEIPEPAWVPTLDSQQCFVGYRCRSRAQRQSSR